MKPKPQSLVQISLAFCLLTSASFNLNGQDLALESSGLQGMESDYVETTSVESTNTAEESREIRHIQKNVINDGGQVYWNKSLPVYISLLTSPDSKDGIVIKANPEGNVEPYYFDTEGINWIRTKWQVDPETRETIYPKQEVMWPVIVDGEAPTANAKFSATAKYAKSSITYYSGDLQIELNAKDATSGVESIFYTLGDPFKEYSSPVTVDTENDWELKFYAVDKVGNYSKPSVEDNSQISFVVDKTAPSTQLEVEGPKTMNILSHRSKLLLSSSDEKSGVKAISYKISDQQSNNYIDPIRLSSLNDGFHELEYSATDNVLNNEDPNTYVFYVDRIAPELSVAIEGDQYKSERGDQYVSQRSSLTLNATDNKAGVDKIHYKPGSNDFALYNDAFATKDLKHGAYTFNYYGNDKVENVSEVESLSYMVDSKSPVIDFSVEGPQYVRHDTLFVRSSSLFTITADDNGSYQSGVQITNYQIGSGVQLEYNDVFMIHSDGLTTLKINSSDNVNNQSEMSQVVFVDNEAPEISHTFSVDKIGQKVVRDKEYTIYPSDVKLYLAGMDEHVGNENIFYRIGDGAEKQYASPVSGFKTGSNVELTVRSVDLLGNESTSVIVFATE